MKFINKIFAAAITAAVGAYVAAAVTAYLVPTMKARVAEKRASLAKIIEE